MLTLTSPIETALHRWPAGLKLGLLAGFTLVLFTLPAPWGAPLLLGLLTLTYLALGRVIATEGLRLLRPLLPFLVFLLLWHLVLGDFSAGLGFCLRLIAAFGAANLVTMTTRLGDMLAVIERLARPLAPLLPPRRLALALAMAIRFLPALTQRLAEIRLAWRARSPRAPGWRILLPATLAALDDAEQVADALRARGGVP